MAERGSSRRERAERRKALKKAEEEGLLSFDFLKPTRVSKKAPAKRRRGRQR